MAERFAKTTEIFTMRKGNKRDYLLPFKIAKFIREIRPDIVHTRNWSAIDGVIGAKIAGIKSVLHGEHGREASDPDGANIVRKNVRKGLSPWISKFVTVSAELKNWLVKDVGIHEEKVIQIINGVDTEKFQPPENKKISKMALGLEEDAFVVGIIGRLDPVKDHETLFRAFRVFCDKHSSEKKTILLVVGTGALEGKLRALSKEFNISEKVIFTGDRENIAEMYKCMNIYVLPSIAEGISNTILEAMACGIPVIATNVGGTPELIDDGKTGFLFHPRKYDELSRKLSFYFNNPSALINHGLHGNQRAREMFSISSMVKKYEEIYESLLHHISNS